MRLCNIISSSNIIIDVLNITDAVVIILLFVIIRGNNMILDFQNTTTRGHGERAHRSSEAADASTFRSS